MNKMHYHLTIGIDADVLKLAHRVLNSESYERISIDMIGKVSDAEEEAVRILILTVLARIRNFNPQ